MTQPRILIAGIGNIFFGDDAFGFEVARRLLKRSWPKNIQVADFGIRSIDVIHALMDDYDVTILIDASQRGGVSGTLYVVEPDLTDEQRPAHTQMDGHSMDVVSVLATAKQMGAELNRVLLVACEPSQLETENGQLGCSPRVEAAMDEAIAIIDRLIDELTTEYEAATS